MPILNSEGRRMEAIAMVEAKLAAAPDDAAAWELKRYLYADLRENDYLVQAGAEPAVSNHAFDHDYCFQLGRALIADPAQWMRGAEYLRITARGRKMHAPAIFHQIGLACQRAGDEEKARKNFEIAKQHAREVGVKNLSGEDKQAYFACVKYLGEVFYKEENIDRAIENWSLYVESNQSGLDTLRLLAELYERKGDALAALHFNEKALMLDGKNKFLLDKKDQYYYSVEPEDLQTRLDMVRKTFDVGYCARKAKSLLNARGAGSDQIEWASHLLRLARVVQPTHLGVLMMTAHAHLKRGEQSEAIPILEEVYAGKPEKFADNDEEEAWFSGTRMLGDLYLDVLGKPDLAVKCYSDYRQYGKSGADTLYKMGRAYEQLGDLLRAKKCYQNVTIYSDHPLVSDAYMALQRLESRN
jgi:tetratricopeptide (TPR) repeat protein